MWEDATPQAPPAPPSDTPPPSAARKKEGRPRSDRDLVLGVQLLLCALALGGALGARTLALPFYPRLRAAYTVALAARDIDLSPFDAQRGFERFAQQSAAFWQQAAQQALAWLRGPDWQTEARAVQAQPQSTRRARAKNAPAADTERVYLPPFALADPLGGVARTPTSPFGWRTDPFGSGGQDLHTGADLAVAQGTPVLAAAAGVARRVGYDDSYGNYVRLLHPGGDETLYAHLQYIFVHAGQSLAAGERLGAVGQTGAATGPHLHFELLHQGVRYDPIPALEAGA